ncbi:MAG: hypothetical protein MK085_00500 [Phycisphaerales bacterium]|nr:hypothetical protein [Phycisphaerales bacterium]
MIRTLACTALLAATAVSPAFANAKESVGPPTKPQSDRPRYADGKVFLGDKEFASWQQFANHIDKDRPSRGCAMNPTGPAMLGGVAGFMGGQDDCARNSTNPDEIYDPAQTPVMQIRVVVHVLRTDDGLTGHIPLAQVHRQIDILNEDFRAIAGTNGANSIDSGIEFVLAQFDPDGNLTNGVNYYDNSDWFADWGYDNLETPYAAQIGWNPERYLNIYTNDAGGGGTLAYASIPQYEGSPPAGSQHDRIVMRWDIFGENPPIGQPYHLGHTLTHEVGHYLGLWHVFQNWNGDNMCGGNCSQVGDAICDTNPQAWSTGGCNQGPTCDLPANVNNFMDYSNDECLTEFTVEQIRRMRCTLMNWRPDIYQYAVSPCNDACPADLDLNGQVDGADLGILFSNWGPCAVGNCCGDFDGNQQIDGADLGILFSTWGECFPCPEGWERDCMGTCFPSWLIQAWKGDGFCDDGTYIPADHGCAECPPNTPIYLDCETFGWDDGDCGGP